MTHQRTTSRLAFIARPGASRVARVMAAVRAGTGAVGVLAPGRLAWRLFVPGRHADAATALTVAAIHHASSHRRLCIRRAIDSLPSCRRWPGTGLAGLRV